MRKLMYLMGAAVPLLASVSAQAQSAVTLYGVVDANYSRMKGGTNTRNGIDSSGLQGSRWGMRGSEDLGNGLKANFVLESGYSTDTGISGQGNRLFGRNAWVGLGGGLPASAAPVLSAPRVRAAAATNADMRKVRTTCMEIPLDRRL